VASAYWLWRACVALAIRLPRRLLSEKFDRGSIQHLHLCHWFGFPGAQAPDRPEIEARDVGGVA
jgi:hypothetical protein